MNRRRVIAALFLSTVIVAVLGVMVVLQQANAQQAVAVFILKHPVLAGSRYSSGDVAIVTVRAAEGDFNYAHRSPDQFNARYTQNLGANDILRDDDLVDAGAQVELAVTLQAPPPLAAGDRIDIFATLGGGRQGRIGQAVTVLTASGGALTILVPADCEAAWIAVAASSVALHAVRTSTQQSATLLPLSPEGAVQQLCGSSCGPPPAPTR